MSDQISNRNPGGVAGVIRQGILNYIKDLHTALPGKIIAFDETTQLASVQPMIKRVFKDPLGENSISLPLLVNVPVWQPRAGGFSFTMPIKAGDTCLIIFNERALDTWWIFGTEEAPQNRRFHSLADAIALVGMAPRAEVIENYAVDDAQFRNDANDQNVTLFLNGDIQAEAGTTTVLLKKSGDITVTTATKVTVQSPELVVNASTEVTLNTPLTTCTGNLKVDGSIAFDGNSVGLGTSTATDHISAGISGNSHTHDGVQTGSGNTGGPQ